MRGETYTREPCECCQSLVFYVKSRKCVACARRMSMEARRRSGLTGRKYSLYAEWRSFTEGQIKSLPKSRAEAKALQEQGLEATYYIGVDCSDHKSIRLTSSKDCVICIDKRRRKTSVNPATVVISNKEASERTARKQKEQPKLVSVFGMGVQVNKRMGSYHD